MASLTHETPVLDGLGPNPEPVRLTATGSKGH
jgi:hypothetical protein